jgi:hypothetical protein
MIEIYGGNRSRQDEKRQIKIQEQAQSEVEGKMHQNNLIGEVVQSTCFLKGSQQPHHSIRRSGEILDLLLIINRLLSNRAGPGRGRGGRSILGHPTSLSSGRVGNWGLRGGRVSIGGGGCRAPGRRRQIRVRGR